MKIELATLQDVPALLDLQRKAFGPLCEELDWKDAPVLTESLEHAYEEFARCTTLKEQNDEGLIIGSKTSIRILSTRGLQTLQERDCWSWIDLGVYGEK